MSTVTWLNDEVWESMIADYDLPDMTLEELDGSISQAAFENGEAIGLMMKATREFEIDLVEMYRPPFDPEKEGIEALARIWKDSETSLVKQFQQTSETEQSMRKAPPTFVPQRKRR